eukprot:8351559-Pyramimonas_sp.AAC.1
MRSPRTLPQRVALPQRTRGRQWRWSSILALGLLVLFFWRKWVGSLTEDNNSGANHSIHLIKETREGSRRRSAARPARLASLEILPTTHDQAGETGVYNYTIEDVVDESSIKLRVMNWNAQHFEDEWVKRLQGVAELVQSLKPHIFAVQRLRIKSTSARQINQFKMLEKLLPGYRGQYFRAMKYLPEKTYLSEGNDDAELEESEEGQALFSCGK